MAESEPQFTAVTNSIKAQTLSEIVSQAETLSRGQIRSLRLQLRPEELGRVEIQLTRDAQGRISARISAERETARQVLSHSLAELREMLSRVGFNVDKLEVQVEMGRDGQAPSDNPKSPLPRARNLVTANETESGGQPLADTEKLVSLRA
jgi:flagellar hook-length control protein FliK